MEPDFLKDDFPFERGDSSGSRLVLGGSSKPISQSWNGSDPWEKDQEPVAEGRRLCFLDGC